MNIISNLFGRILITEFAVLIWLSPSPAGAQTTSFTYQGRLTESGSAASGSFDLQFQIYDAASLGIQVGSTVTVAPVTVIFRFVTAVDGVTGAVL